MIHHCHAYGCEEEVPPKMLMCLRHWRMVNSTIQKLIWKHYRPGQEIDKKPSPEYMLVQRAAVWYVFADEGGCVWPDVPEVGSEEYMAGPPLRVLP
jgi:hypothetical protein